MAPSFTQEYISIGANRHPGGAEWGKNGILAFAAHNYIALYKPEDRNHKGVYATLAGHTDRVNCVNWIRKGSKLEQTDVALVSASADKTLRIWRPSSSHSYGFYCSAVLSGHSAPVIAVASIRCSDWQSEKDWIISSDSNAEVRVWLRTANKNSEPDTVECVQVITDTSRYAISLAASVLPGSTVPILATGTTDSKINIYTMENSKFVKLVSLSGHENWVRSLAFTTYTNQDSEDNDSTNLANEGDLLLASGSQDKYIRIWRITKEIAVDNSTNQEGDEDKEWQDMVEALKDSVGENTNIQLSTKAHILESAHLPHVYTLLLDSVLLGHDDWVYNLQWHPPIPHPTTSDYYQPLSLMSASADKSMMIWTPSHGVWTNSVRVGEVGGNVLAFYTGCWSPNGKFMAGVSYTGAIQLWKCIDDSGMRWEPTVGISGHLGSVKDLTWDKTNHYIVSTSLDQTTRLFAPWTRQIESVPVTTWHEISRPQIHGYNLHCLSFINAYQFVSGADEKVIRIFTAPRTILNSIEDITQIKEVWTEKDSKPIGANLPALGLSNKAVFQGDIDNAIQNPEKYLTQQSYVTSSATASSLVTTLSMPPYEEHLLQHTLWPETEKLYGHPYEVISTASSNGGEYVASACKATAPEHAVIRIFNTSSWNEVGILPGHNLTVTRIKWRSDDKSFVSVSRDRGFIVWGKNENSTGKQDLFIPIIKNPKAHARIIWDVCWSPDDRFFVTGSRDKTVKIWSGSNGACEGTIKLSDSITSVAFAPNYVQLSECYVIAVGLENGEIHVYSAPVNSVSSWTLLLSIGQGFVIPYFRTPETVPLTSFRFTVKHI
ncbi:WD40-repeat-containing domain protein [Paraphysoderma sedebokerense]|nr:WD40-repeat-containing domain protein [Paraphysoderma sedebokerense]